MSQTRPSGNPIVPADHALVSQEPATVDVRQRLNFLPRWLERAGWTRPAGTTEWLFVAVLQEPGLAVVLPWEPRGALAVAQFVELEKEDPPNLEALRQIQDRYQRLVIPPKPDTRATLGDSTVMHLAGRRLAEPFDIYVAIYPGRIDLIHPDLRNARLRASGDGIDGID